MSRLVKLTLTHFRSYEQESFSDLNQNFVIICGPNGSGKTNLLEAVSLLVPGRGLRGAPMAELKNTRSPAVSQWGIAASVDGYLGRVQIGTGLREGTSKRACQIQGEVVKSQQALSEHLAALWLTPQMDGLFLGGGSERRRFLDRMIFAFDPGHTGRISRYENAMSQRNRLLKDGRHDPAWLTPLEAIMAETGVAIAAARLDFVGRLQEKINDESDGAFPLAGLAMNGALERDLLGKPALEVEDHLKQRLADSRNADIQAGGATNGAHKSDLSVLMKGKNIPAARCSTGEQKALLINLVLAFAALATDTRGACPILLLDEVAAHLDENRRHALYERLTSLNGQIWMTGTDLSTFASIIEKSSIIER